MSVFPFLRFHVSTFQFPCYLDCLILNSCFLGDVGRVFFHGNLSDLVDIFKSFTVCFENN